LTSAATKNNSQAHRVGRSDHKEGDSEVVVGAAACVFAAVAEHKINIEMISQGASEINLTSVVAETNVDEAVRAVHAEFFEG